MVVGVVLDLQDRPNRKSSVLERTVPGRYNLAVAAWARATVSLAATKGSNRASPPKVGIPDDSSNADRLGLAFQPRPAVMGTGYFEKRFPCLRLLRRKVFCRGRSRKARPLP